MLVNITTNDLRFGFPIDEQNGVEKKMRVWLNVYIVHVHHHPILWKLKLLWWKPNQRIQSNQIFYNVIFPVKITKHPVRIVHLQQVRKKRFLHRRSNHHCCCCFSPSFDQLDNCHDDNRFRTISPLSYDSSHDDSRRQSRMNCDWLRDMIQIYFFLAYFQATSTRSTNQWDQYEQ